MRLVEVDELFWFVEGDPGIPSGADPRSPWSGVPDAFMPEIDRALRAYETWCMSSAVWTSIAETKAVGTVASPAWDRTAKHGRVATYRRSYAREIRTEFSNARRNLNKIQAEARAALLGVFREWNDGFISFNDVKKISVQLLRKFHERAFNMGRKASGITRFVPGQSRPTTEEVRWFRGAVRQEVSYWNNFLSEVQRGEIEFAPRLIRSLPKPPARKYFIEERIDMYVEALGSTFDSARVTGLPDSVLVYWAGPGLKDKRICEGCEYVVERQPFPKRLVPAVPRAGLTPCRMNCRHRLLVRKAKTMEIARREADLPERQTMVRAMKEIMDRHGGRKRLRKPRGAVTNPWA